jgi:hypothetical protein
MKNIPKLCDHWHPVVSECALRLTKDAYNERSRLERIFHYVRDNIKFGYPLQGDLVMASQTIRLGYGQCNTKSALFVALCRAVGIPARMHFSLISKEIQRGIFTGIAYRLMPEYISHSWVEVFLEGRWRGLDSFINDSSFFLAGREKLTETGWDTGYSIACSLEDATNELAIDEERFVQMAAVTDDHGVWDDPADYYSSDLYRNRPGIFKLVLYVFMVAFLNRRVRKIRGACVSGMCGLQNMKQNVRA